LIVVEDLSKRFDDCQVLDRISLEIPLKKTTFILGPSGHGKTVFLKTLIGLMRPDAGRIRFDGEDLLALNEKELYRFWTGVGFVFQESALIDSLTVGENISLYLTYHLGLGEAEIRERVRGLLAYVGLEHLEGKFPEELSGGTKKRVAVARALTKDPAYLFFDEPTGGIDESNAQTIKDLIARLSRQGNRTTIVVTHDVRMTRELADFVVFLRDGRIQFAGPKTGIDDAHVRELYVTENHEQ
jgi:phospholipid/cholesterol/gamma-HCH transport system ATP-binding protein